MKPLAITLGDPAGIGTEVVFKALEKGALDNPVVFFGSWSLTVKALDLLRLPRPSMPVVAAPMASRSDSSSVFVDVGGDAELQFGKIDPAFGRIALESVRAAVDAIQNGFCDGVVTAPLHKEAILAAGSQFPGHTELLAQLTGRSTYGRDYAMYFESPSLRVALLTVHLPLAEAIRQVTAEKVADLARLVARELTLIHGNTPRLAVAGINPHAGEGGHFGNEEELIRRGVELARESGIEVSGPYSPDTVFHSARKGHFDVVLAMYHDQGLIPVKTLDFERSVNVTLGLPFLRCSVDHGTAFDIAGRGIADAGPMRWAIDWALRNRKRMKR